MELTLFLKNEYFKQFEQGIKTAEYRTRSKHWMRYIEGKGIEKLTVIDTFKKNAKRLTFPVLCINIVNIYNPISSKNEEMYEILVKNERAKTNPNRN